MDVDLKILILEKQINEIYNYRPKDRYGDRLPLPDCFTLRIAELTGEVKALKEYKAKLQDTEKKKTDYEFCDLYYGISEF